MPNLYENETKEDIELAVASQQESPIYYPKIIGQFASGSLQDYGNPRLKEVHVAPGQNIQDAIKSLNASGGGVVRLLQGMHFINQNLDIYSNISVIGAGVNQTFLNFGTTNFRLRIQGTARTETGTVAVTEGSATITGTTTTFTLALAGDFILINGRWWEILSIANDTSLTLTQNFTEDGESGLSFRLADIVRNVSVNDLTIKGGGTASSICLTQYASNIFWKNIFIDDGSASDALFLVQFTTVYTIDSVEIKKGNAWGCSFEDSFTGTVINCVVQDCTNGIVSLASDIRFLNCRSRGNSSNGFYLTTSGERMVLLGCEAFDNDGDGFNIDTNKITFIGCVSRANDNDGIDLGGTGAADDCIVSNCSLISNGAYGIRISGSGSDRNHLINNFFLSNTSGSVLDNGSSTFHKNIGVGTFTAANGANNNIDIGEQAYTRISGPTGVFNITGVTNTANAKSITLFNTTAQDMTLTNQATSDDTQQILTLTGADVTLTGTSLARFQYDATSKKWVLLGTQG